MRKIEEILSGDIKMVGIAGHVNPDGDCIGSTTGLYLYLKKVLPKAKIDLYLEEPKPSFLFLNGIDARKSEAEEGIIYDLFFTCDVSDPERIGVAGDLFKAAKQKVCIDHHISNEGFGDVNHIVPHASSNCEVLADLFDAELMDEEIAQSLYTGMVTDSGVFQFQNTSPHTMRVAASLMEYGFNHKKVIDTVFNRRSFLENKILGYALGKAESLCGGRVIATFITFEEMDRFGVKRQNLNMIVGQLCQTEGAECAVFLYETGPDIYKVSLRSNEYVDVSKVGAVYGGGGHVRAAGCTLAGKPQEVLAQIVNTIQERLR